MDECIFCNFTDDEVVFYSDDLCYGAISLDPVNKHHLLVIPREHHVNFIDVPDDLAAHVFLVAKRLSRALREVTAPISVHHISNDDLVGDYNKVQHYKFHVIPRYPENGVMMSAERGNDTLEQRAGYAADIARQLAAFVD
ncbi:HIT family protein [Rhodococcus sp. NPDC059968]|uniref:HIT family protein n=1 Tax=Rhodococcus sp. NPDC059968 TaxID=3347017 RepID=UPI00366DBC86